jgi:hypothetical protein
MSDANAFEERAEELGFGSASLMLRDRPLAVQPMDVLVDIRAIAGSGASDPDLIWGILTPDNKTLIMAVAAMEASREIKLRG